MKVAAALAVFALAGCQSLPRDDFLAAESRLHAGDLLATLFYLDRVAPADLRYPRARAIAQAIERRLRLSHNLLDEGMQLRAEWRDREAIERFGDALQIWPQLETARVMLTATRHRIEALEARPRSGGHDGVIVQTSPVELTADLIPAAPAGETEPLELPVQTGLSAGDPNQFGEIRRALDANRLEHALRLAESPNRVLPRHPVRARLVDMLHQRALLRYGHGAINLALNDWVRLLRLDPEHAEAAEFAAAARAELAR